MWAGVGLLVTLGTVIRLQQLSHSLFEAYAFRQTQTAFVVREYADSGIDIFRTPLPVFGPNADVPMEMPLFQAIAALLTHVGLSSSVASRTLGLLSFQATAVLLVVLVGRWHGRTTAIAALVLFEFLPFGLQWGASSMIDFFSVALALAMVVGLDRWFDGGRAPWLVFGSLGAVLAFLAKATTAPSWGILLLVSSIVVIQRHGWRATWKRQVLGYAIGPGLGFAGALWWTRYADEVKSSNELTRFLTSSSLMQWNFGTLDQRREVAFYGRIMNRVTEEMLGVGLVMVVIAGVVLVWSRSETDRIRLAAWILTALSGPLVFFNLYFVHDYYLIAVYPAIVVVAAISVTWVAQRLTDSAVRQYAIVGIVAVAMVISTTRTDLGRQSLANFRTSADSSGLGAPIRAITQPDDLVVIIGCDWSPVFLYFAERRGVMFRDEVGSFWETGEIDDYTHLFSCNPDLGPDDYLPDGYTAVRIDGNPNLFSIEPDAARADA